MQIIATSLEQQNLLIVKAPENIQISIAEIIDILENKKPNFEIAILTIQHLPTNEIASIFNSLNKYKQNQATIIPFQQNNKILIIENKNSIQQTIKLIQTLDQKPNFYNPTFITKLKNSKPEKIAEILNKL